MNGIVLHTQKTLLRAATLAYSQSPGESHVSASSPSHSFVCVKARETEREKEKEREIYSKRESEREREVEPKTKEGKRACKIPYSHREKKRRG